MPPRKSTSSVTPADPDVAEPDQSPLQSSPSQSQSQSQSQSRQQVTEQQLKARAEGGVNVEDYLLPRSLTLRLAKGVLPPNTTIQKDAVLAIQKAATVFVSYLSSHANEATLKRTVAPSDVFNVISELEFDGFRSRLEKELDAYTDLKAGKRKKSGPSGADSGAGGASGEGGQNGEVQNEDEDNAARGTKRVKRVSNSGKEGTSTSTNGNIGDEMQEEAENDNENEDDDVPDDEEEEPEEEQEDEEEEEEEDANDDEGQEEEGEEDINRVEDLDRDSQAKRTMDPDVAGDDSGDSEDETWPGSQLKEDMGSA